MKEFDLNYVHIVYFWLKNSENTRICNIFVQSLQKFLDTSKYAKTKFIGRAPKASRDVVDGSFTYSLIVTFESAEAHEKYQLEDAHLLFIKEVSHLWKKVVVYDSTSM